MTVKTQATSQKKLTIAQINKMSFEEAFNELENIIEEIEEEVPLEKLVDNYNNAILLKKYCSKKLDQATLKIEKIENEE